MMTVKERKPVRYASPALLLAHNADYGKITPKMKHGRCFVRLAIPLLHKQMFWKVRSQAGKRKRHLMCEVPLFRQFVSPTDRGEQVRRSMPACGGAAGRNRPARCQVRLGWLVLALPSMCQH